MICILSIYTRIYLCNIILFHTLQPYRAVHSHNSICSLTFLVAFRRPPDFFLNITRNVDRDSDAKKESSDFFNSKRVIHYTNVCWLMKTVVLPNVFGVPFNLESEPDIRIMHALFIDETYLDFERESPANIRLRHIDASNYFRNLSLALGIIQKPLFFKHMQLELIKDHAMENWNPKKPIDITVPQTWRIDTIITVIRKLIENKWIGPLQNTIMDTNFLYNVLTTYNSHKGREDPDLSAATIEITSFLIGKAPELGVSVFRKHLDDTEKTVCDYPRCIHLIYTATHM